MCYLKDLTVCCDFRRQIGSWVVAYLLKENVYCVLLLDY